MGFHILSNGAVALPFSASDEKPGRTPTKARPLSRFEEARWLVEECGFRL